MNQGRPTVGSDGTPTFDALSLGLNIVDILVRYDGTVHPGGKHETEELVVQGGAPAGNAACVMAALGLKSAFLGHFGENTLSRVAREEFLRHGVTDELFLSTPDARPGVAVVQIDPATGDRTVFYNLTDYCRVTAEDLPSGIGAQTRLVLVDGYDPGGAIPLLKEVRAHGGKTVLDLETGEPDLLNTMLSLGTDAILPLEGARELSGKGAPSEVLKELASRTDGVVVVTDGRAGSWALENGVRIHQDAFPVDAVDTTGCGDAFHGAYCCALLQGWTLPARLEFASYVASQVALALGGRSRLPDKEHFRKMDRSLFSRELTDGIIHWLT